MMMDWKTKWNDWDLRISVYAPMEVQNLADDIEHSFAKRGYRKHLLERAKDMNIDLENKWYYNNKQLEKLVYAEKT